MALMPVCSGSVTGLRSAMPGAMMSTLRVSVEAMAGPPSMRLAQRIDHAADHRFADRHFEQSAGGS